MTWRSGDQDRYFALLEAHGAAYCVMSGADLPCILRATTDFAYLRTHGPDPTTHAAIDGTGWVQESVDRAPLAEVGQIFRVDMYHPGHPNGDYQVAPGPGAASAAEPVNYARRLDLDARRLPVARRGCPAGGVCGVRGRRPGQPAHLLGGPVRDRARLGQRQRGARAQPDRPAFQHEDLGVRGAAERAGSPGSTTGWRAPHDWAAGRDPQLDTAVRLALQALEGRTPAAPPTV